jgi:hypothetical protein
MMTTTTTTSVATTSVSSRASVARNGTKVTLPTRVVRREVRAQGTWTRRSSPRRDDPGGSGCVPRARSGCGKEASKT